MIFETAISETAVSKFFIISFAKYFRPVRLKKSLLSKFLVSFLYFKPISHPTKSNENYNKSPFEYKNRPNS